MIRKLRRLLYSERHQPMGKIVVIAGLILTMSIAFALEGFAQCKPTIGSGGVVLCGGNSIQIYVTSAVGGYQWYKDGVAIPASQNGTAAFINATQPGSYYLSGIVSGCSRMSSDPITIYSSPTIYPQGNPNICDPNGSITLQVGTTHSSYSYRWFKDGALINGATGSSYAATSSGNYTAKIVTSSGCGSSSSNGISPNFFTINTTVTPAGPVSLCPGSSFNLTAVPGYSNYIWYKDGVNVSQGSTSFTSWPVSAPGTYQLLINHLGCNQYSSPIVVTAGTAPIPGLDGGPGACVGTSNNVYTTDSGNSNYIWTVSAGGTKVSGGGPTDNTVTVRWDATGPQSVSVNYTTPGGCTGVSPTVRNVTVTPASAPGLTGQPTTCVGTSDNVYTTESGNSNYIWTVSAGGTKVSGGGPTDNTVTVRWDATGPQSVSVNYTNDDGCTASDPAVINVTVHPLPVPAIIDGPTQACSGSVGNVYTTQGGMSNYTWNVTGGTITAGGGSADHTATVTWTSAGTQNVSVGYTNANGCTSSSPGSRTVDVIVPPASITGVAGLATNFIGETFRLQVEGAEDATSFIWNTVSGVSLTPTGSGVPNREVIVNTSSAGLKSLTVKSEKEGCFGPETNVNLRILSVAEQHEVITMPEADINAHSEGFIYLRKHSPNYNGCINEYGPVTFRVRADFGETYNLGELPFEVNINATITAYYDLPAESQSWTINYTLNQNAPEQLFTRILTENPYLLKFIGIKVNSYTPPGDPAVSSFVRLQATYEEADVVQANSASVTLNAPSIDNTKWEQTFTWSSSCPDVTNYEFQLLKIYGGETADWSKALKLYTESSTPQITVSMAEGGYNSTYHWRVKPIGNLAGGVANSLNLQAAWSLPNTFTYTHPEDGRNWIYSRTFTEGNKVSEQVTYANGLQQIGQQQTRIQGTNQIVASQTIQDYVGRNAVSSLPIPAQGVNKMGYINGLLTNGATNYSASDFDITPYNPSSASDFGGYYSGTDQPAIDPINKGVASAEGYPFTRTLFTNDGTGRVKEQGGVGATHAIKGVANRKTVKTFYTNPTEAELVRLFGREAPPAKNMMKVITYDANGTGSASYQTKDGKVIATALVITGNNGSLSPLPSQANAATTVFEEVTANERIDDYTSITRKPLFFTTENSTVTVDYELTPAQLQSLCGVNNSAAGCMTCDYRIEFFLRKADDPDFVHPNLPGPQTIRAGTCSEQTSLKLDLDSFDLTNLSANVNYTLEKKITVNTVNPNTGKTYQREHEEQIRNFYEGHAATALNTINGYITNNDVNGLKAHLDANYTFDTESQQYVIPVNAGSTSCREYIFIPAIDLCPDLTPDANCRVEGKTWEQYFESYMASRYPTVSLRNGSYLSYAFFKNRHTGSNQYLLPGQLNSMITNLIAENSGANGHVTCEMAWKAFIQETDLYKARGEIDFSDAIAEELENIGAGVVPAVMENNFADNFLKALENELKSVMNTIGSEDVCNENINAAQPFFIRKTELYGYIGGSATSNASSPDLTRMYRLVYYDERPVGGNEPHWMKMLKVYAGYSETDVDNNAVIPTLNDFNNALTLCEKYKLFQQTQYGQQNESDADEEANKRILKLRLKCGQLCEGRREEFRQAIIRNIMSQNASATIQHYAVYQSGLNNQYYGVRDESVNSTTYDYSECELDAMVEAVVEHCKENYCNTPLTPSIQVTTDGMKVKVYGTPEEWEKIRKAIIFDFDVEVKQLSQTCSAGWDFIPGISGTNQWSNVANLLYDSKISQSIDYQFFTDQQGDYYISGKIDNNTATSEMVRILLNNGQLMSGDHDVMDFFIAKFSKDGQLLWSRFHDNNINDSSPVQFNNESGVSNGITFVSETDGEAIRDTNTPVQIVANGTKVFTYSEEYYDGHIGQYDSEGNLKWISETKIMTSDQANTERNSYLQVATDEIGNSYVLGGNQPVGQWFIRKRDKDGVTVWDSDYYHISSSPTTYRDPDHYGPFIDNAGNTYFCLVSFGFGLSLYKNSQAISVINSVQSIVNPGFIVIVKLNPDGSYAWHSVVEPSVDPNWVLYRPFYFKPLANSLALVCSSSFNNETIYIDHMPYGPFNTDKFLFALLNSDKSISNYSIIDPFPSNERVSPQLLLEAFDGYELILGTGSSSVTAKRYLCKIKKNDLSFTVWNLETRGLLNFRSIRKEDSKYYFLGTTTSAVLGATTLNLIPTYRTNFFAAQLEINQCPRPSLCFRFTTEKNGVTIPPGLEDVVYDPQPETCEEASIKNLKGHIDQQVEQIVNSRIRNFREQYKACAEPSLINDKLTLTYSTGLHHYTLYYYDRAGNLMRTVPPKGVTLLAVNTSSALAASRNAFPGHTLVTEYQYNSMGQMVREHSPDANYDPQAPAIEYARPASNSAESALNASKYFATYIYNSKGQLRFSRNAKQKQAAENSYSYTKYDNLGRVIEVGEATGYDETLLFNNRNNNSIFPLEGVRHTTTTHYTQNYPDNLPAGYTQRYLRNRVSYAVLDEDGNQVTTEDKTITVYSYDPHGNVEWLIQMIPGFAATAIKYEYDLISGKVTMVSYNPGQSDQFYHKYGYDANNRIVSVHTSRDGYLWEKEANYDYYLHGPLRRTEVGEDKLQGLDYTYTIHGWLKGINAPFGNMAWDPGQDGVGGTETGQDVWRMELGYYAGDYKRPGTVFDADFAPGGTSIRMKSAYNGTKDLYNGNISTWVTQIGATGAVTGEGFTYDELNRITEGWQKSYNPANNTWQMYANASTFDYYYSSNYSYDANGNLMALSRSANAVSGQYHMDQLSYAYTAGTNRLHKVAEGRPATVAPLWSEDIDHGQLDSNYRYDPIGNLISDEQQGTAILWNPYGKVLRVNKTNGSYTEFKYDAAGNRVSKRRVNAEGVAVTNYYVRDASGNIMAVYEKVEQSGSPAEVTLTELAIYGSDRLGNYIRPVTVTAAPIVPLSPNEGRISANTTKNAYEGISYLVDPAAELTLGDGFTYTAPASEKFVVRVSETGGAMLPPEGLYTRELNTRRYELKDHLGNVRVVITDTKLQAVDGIYEPEVVGTYNYYPFGMEQPGRIWTAEGKYRYGYNGKEKDQSGEWGMTNYDYGFRIYNPALAKFLSVDPLTKSYPMLTPYQFASNTPIQGVDLDGAEGVYYMDIFFNVKLWYDLKVKNPAQTGIKNISESQSKSAHYKNPYVPGEVQKTIAKQQFLTGVKQVYKASTEFGHGALDVGGMIPVLGEPLDALNSYWYAVEGRSFEASLSAVSIIPVIGDMSKGGKWILKGSDFGGDIVDDGTGWLYGQFKNSSDDLPELQFLSKKTVSEDGKSLTLEVATYVKGALKHEYKNKFAKKIFQYREAVYNWAKEQGFEKIRITGARSEGSSSAVKGKEIDSGWIDLTEKK